MYFRKIPVFILGVLLSSLRIASAQEQKIADSLAVIYQKGNLTDTAKMKMLIDLSFNEMRDHKKALQYAEELITLSKKSGNKIYLNSGYYLKGTHERLMGNLTDALADFFKSAEIAKELRHLKLEGNAYGAIADIYSLGNNHNNAMLYYNMAIESLRQSNDSLELASVISNAGDGFVKIKNYDSALLYFQEARLIFDKVKYETGIAFCMGNIGMVYAGLGKNDLAEKNLNDGIRILEQQQNYYPICVYLTSMADVYLDKGDRQTALGYIQRSLKLAEQYGLKEQVADASLKLSKFYEETGNTSEALKYYRKGIEAKDSLNNINAVREMADLRTNYEVSQKQAQVNTLEKQRSDEKKLSLALGIILGLACIVLITLLINFRNKQKAYKIINLQKQQTEAHRAKAESTLAELQQTQKHLIQSAKMASLGELTAGIAHEIQNPLNFVNNFSELSVELLDELKESTANKLSSADKAETDEVIKVLADNLKKINDHGKRADSILKGMLQHSRASSGNKEPTDINALAEDYLRLSYHGIRSKDKDFQSKYIFDLDEKLPKIEVVPQDIGRVLINLYNNAFYSVNKKKQQLNGNYEPLVALHTKRIGNKLLISVKDNGTGIPKDIIDKIFQPFFTTKPTGQGTGLGLSLSYDVVKAHGGDLKVETVQGEGAEFIIELPINTRA